MIFKYKCWPCDREIVTVHPSSLQICIICMERMNLIQVGKVKVTEDKVIQ